MQVVEGWSSGRERKKRIFSVDEDLAEIKQPFF
jgi:hypothetical protein